MSTEATHPVMEETKVIKPVVMSGNAIRPAVEEVVVNNEGGRRVVRVTLSFDAESVGLERLRELTQSIENHEKASHQAIRDIVTLPDDERARFVWGSAPSLAVQHRLNLLEHKKQLQKDFDNVQSETLLIKQEYDAVAKAFDVWWQDRSNDIQRLHDRSEQLLVGLEEVIHAHASHGTLINVGFAGNTWQEYELVARLRRQGIEAKSDVIWGQRDVVLSPEVRLDLYHRFLADFQSELKDETLAHLPIRIPGITKSTAKSSYLLPHFVEMLSPSPYQTGNTQLFPALTLVYMAYLKHDQLQSLLTAHEELRVYSDKAWISVYAMVWKDARLS